MSLFKKRRDPMEQMEKELRQETREMEHEVHEMERDIQALRLFSFAFCSG